MGRLPFDPSRMAPPAPPQPPRDRPLRVAELAAMIDGALRRGLPQRVRVVGEISNLRERTHLWFCLKDEDASLDCVMFASVAAGLPVAPAHGMSVVASGRIEHYARQGRTQMYVDALEPVGLGALDLRLRALIEEARQLGWLDPARKRPIPWFPARVAVVTSRSAAALQDVLDTMRRRCPAVELLLVDVRVQGPAAAPEIAAALDDLSRRREALGIDAVLLTRGGGSIEDLWAFNERIVAEAVVRSAAPVVAAIGHETDVTLAELVADERCATPTQAAMRLTPDRAALAQQTDQARRRLLLALRHAVHARESRLERLASRLARVRPEAQHAAREARVAELARALHAAARAALAARDPREAAARLDRAMLADLDRRRQRLALAARALEVASPARVLRRGYSVTFGPDGRALRDAADVRPGDAVRTQLSAGVFRSVVEGDAPAPRRDRAAPKSPRAPRDEPPQMDLFAANG